MAWTINWDDRALKELKELKKLDKQAAIRITNYLDKRVISRNDPRTQGKPLAGDKAGLWRYRIGDYRVICRIEDKNLVVLVLHLGHRRVVYEA